MMMDMINLVDTKFRKSRRFSQSFKIQENNEKILKVSGTFLTKYFSMNI